MDLFLIALHAACINWLIDQSVSQQSDIHQSISQSAVSQSVSSQSAVSSQSVSQQSVSQSAVSQSVSQSAVGRSVGRPSVRPSVRPSLPPSLPPPVSQPASQPVSSQSSKPCKHDINNLCNCFDILSLFCFYSDIWLSLLNVPVLPSEIRRSRTVLDDTSLRALFSQTNSTRGSSINLYRTLILISWCYLFDTRIFDDIFWYSCTSLTFDTVTPCIHLVHNHLESKKFQGRIRTKNDSWSLTWDGVLPVMFGLPGFEHMF